MNATLIFNKLIDEVTKGNKLQFANIVSRNKQQIYDWSNGKRNPTLDNFIDILLVLREKGFEPDLNTIFEYKSSINLQK